MANKDKTFNVFLILTIIVLISILLFRFSDYIQFITIAIGDNKVQKKLLCETDYRLLLKACRELPKPIQNLRSVYYSVESISKYPPDGMSNISQQILINLNPNSIVVNKKGRIHIELGTSFSHFGIKAYPLDFNEPYPGFIYGDRELIPGLWYYDDGYIDYPAECEKKIEVMIQKNKYLLEYGEHLKDN